MATVDVALVINASAIVRDKLCTTAYGDLPNNYGTGYVFGVTSWDNVNFGTDAAGVVDDQSRHEGGVFLDIRAENKNPIRLRTVTLSAGFGYKCYIKSITLHYGTSVSTSAPAHKCDSISYTKSEAGGVLATAQGSDDYWEIDIASQSKAQYRIQYALADSDAKILGGFGSYIYTSVPGKTRYSLG
jgi:hypothetical protein